jgi:hypothetical protein
VDPGVRGESRPPRRTLIAESGWVEKLKSGGSPLLTEVVGNALDTFGDSPSPDTGRGVRAPDGRTKEELREGGVDRNDEEEARVSKGLRSGLAEAFGVV